MSKSCSQCGEEKALTEFGNWKRSSDGKKAYCKACKSKADKEYRARNREKGREANRRYRKNHPDRTYAYLKKYQEENKAAKRASDAAYRARKRNQTPELTLNQQRQVKDIYTACVALNEYGAGIHKWHVDHTHPISRGGLHTPENLQILTAEENLRKGAKVA